MEKRKLDKNDGKRFVEVNVYKKPVDIRDVRSDFDCKNENAKYGDALHHKLERIMDSKLEVDLNFKRKWNSIKKDYKSNANIYAYYLDSCEAIFTKSYTDIKNNKVSLVTIIAICVVLRLNLKTTKDLLAETPHNLCSNIREHRAYETILEHRQHDNLSAEDALAHYNEFLKLEKIKPLGINK